MEPQPIDTAPTPYGFCPILAFTVRFGWEVMSRGRAGKGCDCSGPHWVTLPGYWEREPTHWVALPNSPTGK
jgi:hypothetical protein